MKRSAEGVRNARIMRFIRKQRGHSFVIGDSWTSSESQKNSEAIGSCQPKICFFAQTVLLKIDQRRTFSQSTMITCSAGTQTRTLATTPIKTDRLLSDVLRSILESDPACYSLDSLQCTFCALSSSSSDKAPCKSLS